MQIANTLNLRPFLNLNLDNKTEKKSIWSEPVAQNTFAQLRPQSMSSARKAAAKQKIAELKTRLDAMMKFAGIGKGNPAEAIRLAKELSAAVRAHGGGGGGGAGGVVMPQVSTSNDTAVSTDISTDVAAVSTDQASATADASTSGESAEDGSAAAVAETQSAEQSAKDALTQLSAQLGSATGSLTSGAHANSNLSADDKEFLADAKMLMGRIKMLIALETKKAEDTKKGREAVFEMEKSLDDAPKSLAAEYAAEAQSTTEYTATGVSISPVSESNSVSISV